MTTPKKLRERYVGQQAFKDVDELQHYFRMGLKLPYDYVVVGKILYTQHEYDMGGRTVTYANKTHNRMLNIETSNRYGDTGWTDATVTEYETGYLRNDIVYAH